MQEHFRAVLSSTIFVMFIFEKETNNLLRFICKSGKVRVSSYGYSLICFWARTKNLNIDDDNDETH